MRELPSNVVPISPDDEWEQAEREDHPYCECGAIHDGLEDGGRCECCGKVI